MAELTSSATTQREPLVLPCTIATARGIATATVLDLVLSPGLVALLLLGTLSSATSYLDYPFLRGAVATGTVFVTVLLAQYWLTAVNASRLRAAPGTQLTSSYRDGELVVSGADGEVSFGPGSVRVRRLAGMVVLKRRRLASLVLPGSLVTAADVEFLTRRALTDPAARVEPHPDAPGLTGRDHDNLVRTSRALFLRGGAVGYLVAAVVSVVGRAVLHQPGAAWWVALFGYLAFVGWLAVGRATAVAHPIGSELGATVSDEALEVVTSTHRRIVRFADVRSLAVHHDVLVLRRRGVAAVLVPVSALPDDALPRMRAAFAAMAS